DLMSLSVGECYEIVVTTLAGLYRYRLGDVVKCVGDTKTQQWECDYNSQRI
ncbi:MAG: GH3 auxin-responsive promoter family protein, partial [Desertifilum sp. SIO1I2]|nr:GH3 auxin-responsive promoter family protein [Desertifilum sp. SIO1I2]